MKHLSSIFLASRKAILEISQNLSLEELNHTPTGFNNNIAWNLGHIISTQQLLIYGLTANEFKVDSFIIENFRNKTKPERDYTQEEMDYINKMMVATAEWQIHDYEADLFKELKPFTSNMLKQTFDTIEEMIVFNTYHEGLHAGVILKYRQLFNSK
jgi:hypothetical protein